MLAVFTCALHLKQLLQSFLRVQYMTLLTV